MCSVVPRPSGKSACSSATMFSAFGVKPIKDDLQHGYAWMADGADCSVVLAQCYNHPLGP